LPLLKIRRFGIDDDAVKVKNDRVYGHSLILNSQRPPRRIP